MSSFLPSPRRSVAPTPRDRELPVHCVLSPPDTQLSPSGKGQRSGGEQLSVGCGAVCRSGFPSTQPRSLRCVLRTAVSPTAAAGLSTCDRTHRAYWA